MMSKRLLSLVSVVALAVGFLALSVGSPTVLAHDRYDKRYVYEEGRRMGYERGFRHGREDRYARIGYNYKSHEYRYAMDGYDPRFGHRRDYQRGFRDGYVAGYNNGYYGRRGYYGRGGGYR